MQAGKIASQIKIYAKSIVKKDTLLLEIAEKIEDKIISLGGKIAFPTNLSINEIAAHYTPSYNDETKAHGLLKIDFGVHINGWTADTAFSIDLEDSEENRKLISVSEQALNEGIEKIKLNTTTSEIGKIIEKTISEKGLQPIINLSGHSMEQYDLHSGVTIPNIDDKREIIIEKGLYAVEPFTTTKNATGHVHEGAPSGIYSLSNPKNPRTSIAREILEFIEKEYSTLPFCSRWLIKKFGTRALIALRELENLGIIYQFPQLIESAKCKVAQSEDSVLITEKEKIITTR